MRKVNTSIAILLLVVAFWSGTTWAQDNADKYSPALMFGPQLGVSKSPDADANMIWGAALRLRFLPFLGVEGAIDYRQEDFASDALTVRSWPVQVTGMLYILPVLYGAMGAGWYHTTFDYNPDMGIVDNTQSEFGWHFGGGLEMPLGNTARLTADLRYVFLDYDFENFPGSDDINSDFYMATAGLLFKI